MFENTFITARTSVPFMEFLIEKGYLVEKVGESVLCIRHGGRSAELPVYATNDGITINFQLDIGNVSEFADNELYFKLLDLNTEILPVSIGIDSTVKNDPHLVLVESREVVNMDDNELLSVLDALELAVDKVEAVLAKYMKVEE